MQLNLSLFEFNGSTGILLKPEYMRKKDRMFDPFAKSMDGVVASTLTIRVSHLNVFKNLLFVPFKIFSITLGPPQILRLILFQQQGKVGLTVTMFNIECHVYQTSMQEKEAKLIYQTYVHCSMLWEYLQGFHLTQAISIPNQKCTISSLSPCDCFADPIPSVKSVTLNFIFTEQANNRVCGYDVVVLHVTVFFSITNKPNLHYTRGITPKRVSSAGVHLRGLAPGQHSSEKMSQWWQTVGNTVPDLTDPGIEPR